MAFALLPHAGSWADGDVDVAAEAYRHALPWAHGSAVGEAWPPPTAGVEALAVVGDQVDLSALRRLDDGWLEVRVVNLAPAPRTAVLRGGLTDARAAALRGTSGDALELSDGALTLELRPAEIRTLHVRRAETGLARPDVLDAGGPRQNA